MTRASAYTSPLDGHPTEPAIDYGSPFEPRYGMPDEAVHLIPQPLATTTAGLPAAPRERTPWLRISLFIAGTIAAASALALLISKGS